MTLRRPAAENLQPKAFEFSDSNLAQIEDIINKSVILILLLLMMMLEWIVRKYNGFY